MDLLSPHSVMLSFLKSAMYHISRDNASVHPVDAWTLRRFTDMVCSDERARKVLGYAPLVSREAGMQEMKEWCREYYADLVAGGKGK